MIFTNTESNKSFVSLSLLKTQSSCQWFIVCRLSTFEWKSKWYECTHLINNRLTTSCSSDIIIYIFTFWGRQLHCISSNHTDRATTLCVSSELKARPDRGTALLI